MALNLLQRILISLGPPELAACLMVSVPLHLLVNRAVDAAEKAEPGSEHSLGWRNRQVKGRRLSLILELISAAHCTASAIK